MEFTGLLHDSKSLYGFQADTLDSLVLEFLPPIDHTFKNLEKEEVTTDKSQAVNTYLLQRILNALRDIGFHIPRVSHDFFFFLQLLILYPPAFSHTVS